MPLSVHHDAAGKPHGFITLLTIILLAGGSTLTALYSAHATLKNSQMTGNELQALSLYHQGNHVTQYSIAWLRTSSLEWSDTETGEQLIIIPPPPLPDENTAVIQVRRSPDTPEYLHLSARSGSPRFSEVAVHHSLYLFMAETAEGRIVTLIPGTWKDF